jgi:hypothetical protein
MKSVIEQKLAQAARHLFESQPNLFPFTAATRQTEWNIAHHFANELKTLFAEYDCDTDIVKPTFGNTRPDIIIHRRGSHENNLLVIEIKRDRADVDGEIAKITTSWFRPPLFYQFGAVVVISGSEEPYVVVLQNDRPAT